MNRLFIHSIFGHSRIDLWRGEKPQKGIDLLEIYVCILQKKDYTNLEEYLVLSSSDTHIVYLAICIKTPDDVRATSRNSESKKKLISKLVGLI